MAAVRLDFGVFSEENMASTPSPVKSVDAAPPAPAAEAPEDADAAFARLVAEQERAFFLMRGGNAAELAELGGDAAPSAAPNAVPAPATEEEDADVAFARALAEEEAREWNARMLALAGLPPPGAAPPDAEAAAAAAAAEDEHFEDDPVDVDAMSYEELLALGEAAGTVSRGVSASVVAALPRSAYSAEAHAAARGAEQCAVCRVEFDVGDACATLPCGHFYHDACVAPWLALNKACPCCKRDVVGTPAAAARGAGSATRARRSRGEA